MYINDIKDEFYEYLIGKNIIIFVHYDVDAICTCKILQTIIKYSGTQYTLRPVQGINELKIAYKENCEQIKCFILINCGGTIDLVEELDPADDIIFFVLDSHRPTDVCNIYSNSQIRLLWSEEDDQNVPEFDDIFKDEETENVDEESQVESDDEDNQGESRAAKRKRAGEEQILKRRERRLWEDKRDKLMFDYSQFSYYAKASAITMFNLAHNLAKDSTELLWLAILSLTEQYLLGKIESSEYCVLVGNIQLEVDRLNRRQNTYDAGSSLQITFEEDIKISLYRQWSVEQSLQCSLYPASRMKLWTRRGHQRLQELFVEIGLPLAQSRQRFNAMELAYRREFASKLKRVGPKFGLDDLVYPSFTLRQGYRGKFAAADMVYIVLALLEQPKTGKEDLCFSDALDCLARPTPQNLLEVGLERAKRTFDSCQNIMKTAVDQRNIFSAGPFLYFFLHESAVDCATFSRPHSLFLLARYLQTAYYELLGARASTAAMPMLISAPCQITSSLAAILPKLEDEDPDQQSSNDMCLLMGLPPLCENSPKNFFGKAFEQAAEKSNCSALVDYFDSSYIFLRSAHRTKFLDSLATLLS